MADHCKVAVAVQFGQGQPDSNAEYVVCHSTRVLPAGIGAEEPPQPSLREDSILLEPKLFASVKRSARMKKLLKQ